jgi:hypothetical protein
MSQCYRPWYNGYFWPLFCLQRLCVCVCGMASCVGTRTVELLDRDAHVQVTCRMIYTNKFAPSCCVLQWLQWTLLCFNAVFHLKFGCNENWVFPFLVLDWPDMPVSIRGERCKCSGEWRGFKLWSSCMSCTVVRQTGLIPCQIIRFCQKSVAAEFLFQWNLVKP